MLVNITVLPQLSLGSFTVSIYSNIASWLTSSIASYYEVATHKLLFPSMMHSYIGACLHVLYS